MDGNYAPEVGNSKPTWLDVSPPLRFLRLARAVRRVGMVPVDILCDLTPAKTRSYCADLLDAAGLPQSAPRRLPRLPRHARELSPMGSLRLLIHDAHVASTHLHRLMPAALLAPLETAIHRADELHEGPLKEYSLARLPPLMSVGGRSVPSGVDPTRFAECAVAGAYQRLLWQLVGDTEPLNFAGLPSDGAGLAVARRALALLRERTQRPVVMRLGDDEAGALAG